MSCRMAAAPEGFLASHTNALCWKKKNGEVDAEEAARAEGFFHNGHCKVVDVSEYPSPPVDHGRSHNPGRTPWAQKDRLSRLLALHIGVGGHLNRNLKLEVAVRAAPCRRKTKTPPSPWVSISIKVGSADTLCRTA
eukprot:NODE_1784_length_1303_cov_3720.959330_g1394_i1.p1 GENE.NODE_1784_length_1303_cov_3720.959330_g1394_i1~~NODE_1784_length_1303_cov_3720.959330_g1394_i1.p1  ORF type:complete len:136 (-),score=14.00 NODE_1784_length_1303_cov_3720.959330_g1394_i1:458-865(-)